MVTENVFQDGPYLAAALLCERILVEKDGVKSLIRIVNRITSSVRGIEVPAKMPPYRAMLSLYLALKTGSRTGKHEIKVHPSRPDNTQMPPFVHSVNLETPENRGIDLIVNLNLILDQEGIYWLSVYFDQWLMTKIPLQVLYITQSTGGEQSPMLVQ